MYQKQRVYVIWNTETKRTKVGVSADVKRRLNNLETASGCKLELIYQSIPLPKACIYESNIHDRFRATRYIGEWFNTKPDKIIKYIREIIPSDEITEDEVLKMRDNGNSAIMIAAHFGVSRQTIYNIIRKKPIKKIEYVKPEKPKPVKVKIEKKTKKISKNLFQGQDCFIIEIYKNGEMYRERFEEIDDANERLNEIRSM